MFSTTCRRHQAEPGKGGSQRTSLSGAGGRLVIGRAWSTQKRPSGVYAHSISWRLLKRSSMSIPIWATCMSCASSSVGWAARSRSSGCSVVPRSAGTVSTSWNPVCRSRTARVVRSRVKLSGVT
jgi:hypothetical protein